MSDFFTIFNPGLRFWRQQQDLEKVLVVDDKVAGSGPGPIDLDSGRVTISVPAPAGYDAPMESLGQFEEVADRVYRAVAEPDAVNIGLVVGSTGALVVDTGSSPSQGAAILAAARDLAGEVPVVAVVVTHHHHDHLHGLAAFDGIESIGHATLAASAPDGVALPTRGIHLAAAVDLGDCRAEVVHFGPAHTPGDVVVIVPERGVVLAGDLVEQGAFPDVGPDTDLKAWPSALDGVLGVLTPETIVVPGHGDPVGFEFTIRQRGEIAGTYSQVEDLYTRRVPLQDAWAAASWLWDEPTVRGLLPHVYAGLAAAGTSQTRTLPLL